MVNGAGGVAPAKVAFSSVTLKIERRGINSWRVVFKRVTDGAEVTSEQTEWLPRVKIYAHVAMHWKALRAFVYEGMGRVPA